MKLLIASFAALGVIATPAIAQTSTKTQAAGSTTKTMATTKTTHARSGEKGESAAQEAREHHAAARHHHKKHHHRHAKATKTATSTPIKG